MSAPDTETDRAAKTRKEEDDRRKALEAAESKLILAARVSLKQQIESLVAIHQKDDPPPFTAPELIVMAIVASETQYCTKLDIVDLVKMSFTYYDYLVKLDEEESWRYVPCPNSEEEVLSHMGGDFLDAFDAWEVPLLQGWRDLMYHLAHYGVKTEDAQIFLGRWLEPKRTGTFRFLELPAELRNRIYEMVLVFPKSKVQLEEDCMYFRGRMNLFTTERDTDNDIMGGRFIVLQPRAILDIALVNRQLARETIPIFYGTNTFTFRSISDLTTFVKLTSPRRMQLIKNIDISTDIYGTANRTLWLMQDNKEASVIWNLSTSGPPLSHLKLKIGGRIQWNFASSAWRKFEDYSSLRALARWAAQAKKCRITFDYGRHSKQEYIKAIQEPMVEELKRLKGTAGSVKTDSVIGHLVVVEDKRDEA